MTSNLPGYFARRHQDPDYAAEVQRERARINAIDRIVRQLDDAREEQGLSKAELARRTGRRAEFLRRLFTAQTPNPTLETVVEVAAALDLELSLTAREDAATRR